jgi:HEAT repeat protein
VLRDALQSDRYEAVRRAAIGALAQLGTLVDATRTDVVDAIERTLRDTGYLVRVSAFAAAEKLGDSRLLPALDRLAETEDDGRLRRDAAEAAIRIREAQTKPAALVELREELDRLRAEAQSLRERLDAAGTK